MIKVMWFLKRADHLTLEQFHKWWIKIHVPMIVEAHTPYLKKYVVNLRWPDDPLPGRPTGEMDWDGCAEQWFETQDDFNAVYGKGTDSITRADTLKNVSRHARMVMHEHSIELHAGSSVR